MENPYEAPVSLTIEPGAQIPEKITKDIRNGWIAACIAATATLILVLFYLAGTKILGFDLWNLVDVAIVFLLAFGIYKRSRTAATIMVVYFVASKIFILVETGKPNGLIIAIIYGYFYTKAMIATYKFHKIRSGLRV